MKFYCALALMLALVTFAASPVAAQTWNPPDADAVLKGIAEETLGVKLIRVLPVGSSGGGTAADVNVLNWPATQPVSGTVGVSGTVPVAVEPGATVNVGNLPATQEVSGSVAVTSAPPVTFAATQPVEVTNLPATQPISGTVSVDNLPATQPVSGTVGISGSVPVDLAGQIVRAVVEAIAPVSIANFPATQPVSGSVSVGNFPATQAVTIADTVPVRIVDLPVEVVVGTVEVMPSVEISNFPTTQPVSGSVSVSNLPATQPVSVADPVAVTGTFYPATQPVSGTIDVGNFPATQPVSGSVSVSNMPTEIEVAPKAGAPLAVTGTFYQATQPVSGSVAVSNFPAAQAVTGDFYPPTQPVSGSVNVGNLPAVQTVTFDGATQPVRLEGAIQATIGDVTFAGTQPVEIDDETPVRVAVPGSVAVTGDFYPTTQPVSGSVSVDNFPASQAVSGTVDVGNFPATQPVSGTVAVSSLPSVTLAGTSPVEIDDEDPVRVALPGGAVVSVSNLPATQAVSGTVSVDSIPAISFASTQPVEIDDETPVRVEVPGAVAVSNFPGTQAVTPAGTFPVYLAPETPVRIYSTDTLPVAVVYPPTPVRQRWSETIAPTIVDGSAYTFELTHEPIEWTLEGLSDTLPIFLEKGGAPATTASYKIRPGKSITRTDGGKIFSIYAEADANPASFQLYSVYEVVIGY